MRSYGNYKRVAAIVVTYNANRWVNKCLGSLVQSTYPVKIYVVDNCSTDDTISIIEGSFPEVVLMKSPENLGFGKANNLALSRAVTEGAEYFFLLNHDAWVTPEAVGNLVEAIDNNPDYGIISPLHYTASGDKLDKAFSGYIKRAGFVFDLLRASPVVNQVNFINAAAWMIKRECLEEVGGFGYLFHHYGEDRDYVQRARYFGYKTGFISNTRIFHDREGRTFDLTMPDKLIWYYHTGSVARLADINKHFNLAVLQVYFWMTKDLVMQFLKSNKAALKALPKLLKKNNAVLPNVRKYRGKIAERRSFRFLTDGMP